MRVTVITVTYGNRWHLLRATLERAFAEGACDAVIVDNASADDIGTKADAIFPGKTHTFRSNQNLGSAGGYRRGIEDAIARGAEYLLLLDDDNGVCPGFMRTLTQAYSELSLQTREDALCVFGSRKRSHVPGSSPKPIADSANAFLDFDLASVPEKIRSRMLAGKVNPQAAQTAAGVVARKVAPYGGLFFHRSVIERFGYPNEDLVLYQDDLEFTYRISSRGGRIWQVMPAEIDDLEESWFLSGRRPSSFEQWLEMGSDRQVFYTARNKAYFETHLRRHGWVRILNKACYLTLLCCFAVARGRMRRFNIVLNAVRNGEQGILGVNPEFRLQ